MFFNYIYTWLLDHDQGGEKVISGGRETLLLRMITEE